VSKTQIRLYVAGRSANAVRALRNLTRFCEQRLHGAYELRVVDVLKEPEAAAADGVIATPTLIKETPDGIERIFGSLDDAAELERLLGPRMRQDRSTNGRRASGKGKDDGKDAGAREQGRAGSE